MSAPINKNSGEPHPTMTVPVARFGGCWDGVVGSEVECTEVCDDPKTRFYSGTELGNQCAPGDVASQRCVGGIEACSMGGCPIGTTIAQGRSSVASTCSLIHDTSSGIATLYGACQNSSNGKINGCFWSRSDCHPQDERWLLPDDLVRLLANEPSGVQPIKPYCDCSDVRVGACRSRVSGRTVCTVDSGQCLGEDEYFVTARQLVDHPDAFDSLDCRLCPIESVSMDAARTRAFVSSSTAGRGDPFYSNQEKYEDSNLILASVLSAAAVFVVVLLCAFTLARNGTFDRDETEGSEKDDNDMAPSANDGEPSAEVSESEDIPAKDKAIV